MLEYIDSFKQYKNKCLVAAKDFDYPQSVIDKINAATTVAELCTIMTTARQRYL